MLLCALLLLLPFSLGSGVRMSESAIVCGMGVDKNNDGYTVTLQYLNLYKGSGKNDGISGNITAVATADGASIEEAVSALQKTLGDQLFFGQNEVLVVGQGVEQSTLHAYIEHRSWLKNDVLLARGTPSARAVLENAQRGASVPAYMLTKQLRRSRHAMSVNNFLRDPSSMLPGVVAYKDFCLVP